MKGLFGAFLALFLIGSAESLAEAQTVEPTPAQVRTAAEAFDRGRDAYRAEDYVGAAEQFETADANAPSSAALELAIRSRDKAEQLDRAATLAALALQRYPEDKNIQKVAPPILERARQELHTLTVHCSEACELLVGSKLVHGAPNEERTLFVAPGRILLRAGWSEGRSVSRTLDVTAASSTELKLEPEPLQPARPVQSSSRNQPSLHVGTSSSSQSGSSTPAASGLSPTLFWGGVVVTGLSGGVLLWSTIDLYSGLSAYKAQCNTDELRRNSPCTTMLSDGFNAEKRTNILIGVTAGLGAATALVGLFGTNWSGGSSKSSGDTTETAKRGRKYQIEPWIALGKDTLIGATGRF